MSRRRFITGFAAVIVLVIGALYAMRTLSRARTFQLFGPLVAEVPTRDSLVALSFDDGPVAAVADSLLATLRARDVQATFFVTGRELATAPEAGARLVAAGHELGNHSFSHDRMVLMRQSTIAREIETTDSLIRNAGQSGQILFRPPFGNKLVGLPWYLSRTHRTTVMWSIEPDSYADVAASSARIVSHVMARVHAGSIVLLHVWYPIRRTSREAVGPLIDSLKARGYRVTTVGALLAASAHD